MDWRLVDRISDYFPFVIMPHEEAVAVDRTDVISYYSTLSRTLDEAIREWSTRERENSEFMQKWPGNAGVERRLHGIGQVLADLRTRRQSIAANMSCRMLYCATTERIPAAVMGAGPDAARMVVTAIKNSQKVSDGLTDAADRGNAMLDAQSRVARAQELYIDGKLPESEFVAALEALEGSVREFGSAVGHLEQDKWSWFIDSAGLLANQAIPAGRLFAAITQIPSADKKALTESADALDSDGVIFGPSGMAYFHHNGSWSFYDGTAWRGVLSHSLANDLDQQALSDRKKDVEISWQRADAVAAKLLEVSLDTSDKSGDMIHDALREARQFAADNYRISQLDAGRLAKVGLCIMKAQAEWGMRRTSADLDKISRHAANMVLLANLKDGEAVPDAIRMGSNLPAGGLRRREWKSIESIIATADSEHRRIPDDVKRAIRDAEQAQMRSWAAERRRVVREGIEKWKKQIEVGLAAIASGDRRYWAAVDEWLASIDQLERFAEGNGQALSAQDKQDLEDAVKKAAQAMQGNRAAAINSIDDAKRIINSLPKPPIPPRPNPAPIRGPNAPVHPTPKAPQPNPLPPSPPPRPKPMGPIGHMPPQPWVSSPTV